MLYLAVAAGDKPPAELVAPVVQQLFVVEGSHAAPVTERDGHHNDPHKTVTTPNAINVKMRQNKTERTS